MKKIALTFMFCTIFLSCERNFVQIPVLESSINSMTRTYDEAYSYAEQSMKLISESATKSGDKRSISECQVILSPATKSSLSDTLMYVFNFSDSSGFSVIAADRREFPIIALTEKGNYSSETLSGVPPVDDYLKLVINNLSKEQIKTKARPDNGIDVLTNVVYSEYKGPFIDVQWGQDSIYGAYCPNGIAGCVAVAIAQIMSYHKYPNSFVASVDMGNDYDEGDVVSLDWNNMLLHTEHHISSQGCTPYHKQISALMREIGEHVSMDYSSPSESGAYGNNVSEAIDYFGYVSDSYSSATTSKLLSSLNNDCPAYMDGIRIDSNNKRHGHAWVVDGFVRCLITIDTYDNGVLVSSVIDESRHVMHINWGWDGDCNGYFYFGNYDTSNGETYDGTHYMSRNYTDDMKLYTNINIE